MRLNADSLRPLNAVSGDSTLTNDAENSRSVKDCNNPRIGWANMSSHIAAEAAKKGCQKTLLTVSQFIGTKVWNLELSTPYSARGCNRGPKSHSSRKLCLKHLGPKRVKTGERATP